jgi:hypothetical protein
VHLDGVGSNDDTRTGLKHLEHDCERAQRDDRPSEHSTDQGEQHSDDDEHRDE